MTRLETIQLLMQRLLDRILVVFDKAVLAIPPDQLDFRPTPANMRARELAHHVYQVVYLLTRATEAGHFRFEEFDALPFDLEAVTQPEEIVAYGSDVKAYVREAVAAFTEEHLERAMEKGPRPNGFETMLLAIEEAIHHRGQLSTYLRLMGVKPPFLYDYS